MRAHRLSKRVCVCVCTGCARVITGQHEHGSDGEQHEADQRDDALEEDLELLGVEFAAQVIHEGVNLTEAEHAESCHVLRGLNGLWEKKKTSMTRLTHYMFLLTQERLTFTPLITRNKCSTTVLINTG